MAGTSLRLLRQDQGKPEIDEGSQFESVRVYVPRRVLSIMVLPDGTVVDKHQMSVDAGRAALIRRRYHLGRRHILCHGHRHRDLFDFSQLTSVIFMPFAKALLQSESQSPVSFGARIFDKMMVSSDFVRDPIGTDAGALAFAWAPVGR